MRVLSVQFLLQILLTLLLNQQCNSSGNFYLKFISHTNPQHRLSSGRCCEQGLETNCTRDWKNLGGGCTVCNFECDYYFHINVSHVENKTKHVGNDTAKVYGIVKTDILSFKDDFLFQKIFTDSIENPLKYFFHTYTGQFELVITSYDVDRIGNDTVDVLRWSFPVKDILPTLASKQLNPYDFTLNGTYTRIALQAWSQCSTNFFGPDCTVYCVAQNNSKARYGCNENTGEKYCLQGWIDLTRNCTTRKKCNCTSTIDIKLKGSFNKINTTTFLSIFKQLVYDSFKKNCISSRDHNKAEHMVVILLNKNNITSTFASINFTIIKTAYECNAKKSTNCILNTLYKSTELSKQLNAQEINICSMYSSCNTTFSRAKQEKSIVVTEGKKNIQRNMIIAVVLSAIFVVAFLMIIVYAKNKKRRKIGDQDKSENKTEVSYKKYEEENGEEKLNET